MKMNTQWRKTDMHTHTGSESKNEKVRKSCLAPNNGPTTGFQCWSGLQTAIGPIGHRQNVLARLVKWLLEWRQHRQAHIHSAAESRFEWVERLWPGSRAAAAVRGAVRGAVRSRQNGQAPQYTTLARDHSKGRSREEQQRRGSAKEKADSSPSGPVQAMVASRGRPKERQRL